MKLTETQVEDVFERFYRELIAPDLTFKGRQVTLKNRLRLDLLFRDKEKRNVVVELKKDAVTKEDVGGLLLYAGSVPNSRVVLIAPFIASSIKTAFEHYGIEYIEYSMTEVAKLYRKIKDKPRAERQKVQIPPHVISEPLANRALHDGNIAFKVTYNDKNWSGICSPDVFEFNAYGRKPKPVFWCKEQAPDRRNCQKWKDKELSRHHYPCYDAIALKTMSFSPGWNHGQNRAYVCLQAKVGKMALLTSRKPGDPETARFIFCIFEIEKITHPAADKEYGHEYYDGNKKTAIRLDPSQYVPYWDYHSNPNHPDKIDWKTGLFRYVKDATVRGILNHILESEQFSRKQKNNAAILLRKVR